MDNIVYVEPTQPPIEVRVRSVKEMQRFFRRIRPLANLDTTPRRILDAMIPREFTGQIWRYEDMLE